MGLSLLLICLPHNFNMQMLITTNQTPENNPMKVWLSANQISVIKLKAKDKQVFKTLYAVYAPLIYGAINRALNDDAKSAEVLERTFLKAWESVAEYDESKLKIYTWLNRIATQETVRLAFEPKII